MLPITIQDLDEETTDWIDQEAKKRAISPEQLVSELLRELVLSKQEHTTDLIHHDLTHLAGTWSQEELREFLAATADFEKIDEELWP